MVFTIAIPQPNKRFMRDSCVRESSPLLSPKHKLLENFFEEWCLFCLIQFQRRVEFKPRWI